MSQETYDYIQTYESVLAQKYKQYPRIEHVRLRIEYHLRFSIKSEKTFERGQKQAIL